MYSYNYFIDNLPLIPFNLNFTQFYVIIILLPFFASILIPICLNFKLWSQKTVISLNIFSMFLTFILSWLILKDITENQQGLAFEVILWNWFNVGYFIADVAGFFDPLTGVMLVVICTVSFFVHLYATSYMETDPHLPRFISYLSLFTFFMIILVTSSNFIQLFVGWEGVGICSYLLINFWYTRIQANKAALKAVIVNRIGDTALAIGIFIIFTNFGTLDFVLLSGLLLDSKNHLIDINTIAIFLFIGCMGKSAQLGLHTWLPDAMEGPTPVSALLHAATMVTAGVFLLVRCSFIFQEAPKVLPFITIIGGLTALFGATTAMVQNDLKRVIAYSTCSQLGYMVMACGLSCFNGAMFHLYNHAFFKALLFLSAGSIIHALNNEQDMRKMGALVNILPFTYCMVLIGSLALMGFPFLSGYYSKEFILEVAFAKCTIPSHFGYWLGCLATSCTAFYSIRSLFLIFFGEVNAHKAVVMRAHDAPPRMLIPLAFLAILSIYGGYLARDAFIGLGTPFWSSSITIYPADIYTAMNAEFLPYYIKIIPLLFSFVGTGISIFFYSYFLKNKKIYEYTVFYTFLNRKWYFDTIYNDFIVQRGFTLGYGLSYTTIDRGFLELIGSLGLAKNVSIMALFLKKINEGSPTIFFLYFIQGAFTLFFLTFLILNNVFILLILVLLFLIF